MLVLATIPALIICGNLVMAEAIMTEQADATGLRFVIVSLFTFFLMTLMVIAGICFLFIIATNLKQIERSNLQLRRHITKEAGRKIIRISFGTHANGNKRNSLHAIKPIRKRG